MHETLLSLPHHWWIAASVCALGIVAACLLRFESHGSRTKRAQRKKEKELRVLADRISTYGQSVHHRFPTGAVVVSERDLADQLRKQPDTVVTALNLLLNEQKVQTTQLKGYWKLNI